LSPPIRIEHVHAEAGGDVLGDEADRQHAGGRVGIGFLRCVAGLAHLADGREAVVGSHDDVGGVA
jgi:hypothetical protein